MPDSAIADGAFFRALFATAADAILVVDARGRIVLANAACGPLFGKDPGALAGRPVEALVPGSFGDHVRRRESDAVRPRPRPRGRGLQVFALHADGREIPVDISLSPFTFEGRSFVACAIRDQRGSSRAPDALRVQATALRSAANGVVITDREGTITWVNPAASAITGYSEDELVGQHTRILKSGRHEPSFYARLWKTVTRGESWSGTIVNRRKDGTEYQEEQTIAPVLDDTGAITHFIAIKQDVTEQRRTQAELARKVEEIEGLNAQLREQTVRDPLTGLHNRRYLEQTMKRDISRARRTRESIVVAVIDVDHFKSVNDTHGHAVGDRVLMRLADVLLGHVRSSDLVCRVGGEEFVVVMSGASVAGALKRAEIWRFSFAESVVDGREGMPARATISVGIARYRDPLETFAACLKRADEALYEAKRTGRDRVVIAKGDSPGNAA
ncbi:MAG TPA: diguanylate cyclase [Thermoanaerobaculia bacterium]|jgi:diguanylate cyclase (GGDEF)-like protein/PAS domain S-box-containing protein